MAVIAQISLAGEKITEFSQTETAKCLSPAAKATTTIYDTNYLADLIKRDRYIFDIRCWKNGITKQEFFKLWNAGFRSRPIMPDNESDEWWNAGHFAYAVDMAKDKETADPELVWKCMEQYKEQHLKSFVDSWKKGAEEDYEWYLTHKKTSETFPSNKLARELMQVALTHARNGWELMDRCLKELGLPEEPMPGKYLGGGT